MIVKKELFLIIAVVFTFHSGNILGQSYEIATKVIKCVQKPGVNLAVGKPVMLADTISKTIQTNAGDWSLLCGYSITSQRNQNPDDLFIMLKVDKHK